MKGSSGEALTRIQACWWPGLVCSTTHRDHARGHGCGEPLRHRRGPDRAGYSRHFDLIHTVDVDVECFAVADAQEFYDGGMEQLGWCPEPVSRQRPAGPMVNQANQIQIVRHDRELAADSLLSEHEPGSAW